MSDPTDSGRDRLAAGVIGVGSMGRHHARVYSELSDVRLVGVSDADEGRARDIAAEYDTRAMGRRDLLEEAEMVSVAVPTEHHYATVDRCIDAGVDVLVEKPFVADLSRGEELAERARRAGVVLQVGHVERFNPATRVLADVVTDLDVVAIAVDRLGPPLDRTNDDSVVMDLMVHDVDILLSMLDGDVESVSAVAYDDRHVAALLGFDDGSIAELTASRLTQQKVRRLSVTALSCRVNVDFIAQSVEIHRRSLPRYIETDGDIRYSHESVVERPMVENGEPLKHQLAAFATAVRERSPPLVTAEDALRVLRLTDRIEDVALGQATEVTSS